MKNTSRDKRLLEDRPAGLHRDRAATSRRAERHADPHRGIRKRVDQRILTFAEKHPALRAIREGREPPTINSSTWSARSTANSAVRTFNFPPKYRAHGLRLQVWTITSVPRASAPRARARCHPRLRVRSCSAPSSEHITATTTTPTRFASFVRSGGVSLEASPVESRPLRSPADQLRTQRGRTASSPRRRSTTCSISPSSSPPNGYAHRHHTPLAGRSSLGQALVRRALQSARRHRAALVPALSQTARRARAGRRARRKTPRQEVRAALSRTRNSAGLTGPSCPPTRR